MTRNVFLASISAALFLSLLGAQAADSKAVDLSKFPPAKDKSGLTYTTDIKSIFDASCARCHGADRPKARLRLDSLQGALKGGESGKVILPGDSAKSILVHCVAHVGHPDTYMPPPKNKANIQPLTKDQVGIIRAWIDQGAK